MAARWAPSRVERTCMCLSSAAWAGNALYAAGAPDGILKALSPAIVAAAMIAFLIVHGRRCDGARSIAFFVVTVFLIGWSAETISILTGVPFGSYHHTDLVAPFLWHIPISVMPAYCVMGYVLWSMARILLLRLDDRPDGVTRYGTPAVAAVLMVLWDLSTDPLRATVEGR